MPYMADWQSLPEIEILPGNFRRSAAGLQTGANRIRLVHPSGTPLHHHETEEQMVFMLEGEMDVTIGPETFRMRPGAVCAIPAGAVHQFQSIADEALFIETFSPMRVQNLIGFLGRIF